MLAGLSTWRGTLEVEADRIYLKDEQGDPHDIRDLFLQTEAVTSVESVQTDIGGGLPPQTTLTWPDPSDDKVPGLKSLLDYLAEERPTTKNFYVTTIQPSQILQNETTFLARRVTANRILRQSLVSSSEPTILRGKTGARGREGRAHIVLEPRILTRNNTRLVAMNSSKFAIAPEQPIVLAQRPALPGPVDRQGSWRRSKHTSCASYRRRHERFPRNSRRS